MAQSTRPEGTEADVIPVARSSDDRTTALWDPNISDLSSNNPYTKRSESSFNDIYATDSGAPPVYTVEWQPMQPSAARGTGSRQAEVGSAGTSPSLTNASTASSSSRLENFSSTSVDKGKGKAAGADIFAWAVKNNPFRDSDGDDDEDDEDATTSVATVNGKGKGKATGNEWTVIHALHADDSDDDIPPPQDRECMVCAVPQPPLDFPARPPTKQCQHRATVCSACISLYIEAEVTSKGAGAIGTIKCPVSECQSTLEFEDVARASDKGVFERYETLLLRQELGKEGDFVWCKNPKCGHGQLHAEPEQNPIVICHSCKAKSCFQHDCLWHEGITCTQYDRELNGEDEPAPAPAPAVATLAVPVPSGYVPAARPTMPGGWDGSRNDTSGGGWNIPRDVRSANSPPSPTSSRLQKQPPQSSFAPSPTGIFRNLFRSPLVGGPRKPATSSSSAPGPSSRRQDGLTDEDLAIFAQFSEDPSILTAQRAGGADMTGSGSAGGRSVPPVTYRNQPPSGGRGQPPSAGWDQQPSAGWGQQPPPAWVDPDANFDSDRALAQRLAAEEQQFERDRQMAFEMEREMRANEEIRVRRDEERMREQERRRMEQERARVQQEMIRIEQERAREWRRQEQDRDELRRRQHVESERQRLAEAQMQQQAEPSAAEQRRKQQADKQASERWLASVTRECPGCSKPIEKNGGCDHMKCSRCNKDFSWAKARPTRPK